MTTNIDWSSNATSLKRQLLSLTKSKLTKLCKIQKVSCNGNKNVMIGRLIHKAQPTTEFNIKPSRYKYKINQIVKNGQSISTIASEKFALKSVIATGYIGHNPSITIPKAINDLCCKYYGHELIVLLNKCTKEGNPKLVKKLIVPANATVKDIIGECLLMKPCEFENKLFQKTQWFRLWRKCNGSKKKTVKWKLITKPNDLLSKNNLKYSNYIEFMVDIFDPKKGGQYKQYAKRDKKRWLKKLQVGDVVEIEDVEEWKRPIFMGTITSIRKEKYCGSVYYVNTGTYTYDGRGCDIEFPYSHYPYYPTWLNRKIFQISSQPEDANEYFHLVLGIKIVDSAPFLLNNKLPNNLYSMMYKFRYHY